MTLHLSIAAQDQRLAYANTVPAESYFERTGKLGPKIDVYFVVTVNPLTLTYKHTTQWHRTCREAREAAAKHYGLPWKSLRAYRVK